MTDAVSAEGATTTWMPVPSSTVDPLDWDVFLASFGTLEPLNYTTLLPWWLITTTTGRLGTCTLPSVSTTPPSALMAHHHHHRSGPLRYICFVLVVYVYVLPSVYYLASVL